MNVRAVQRAGARSYTRAYASSDDVRLEPVREPATIDVGKTATYEYELAAQTASSPLDPDWCVPAGVSLDGYEVRARAAADGSIVASERRCLPAGIDRSPRSFLFELTGTSPGTVGLRITAHGQTSGNLLAERNIVITIEGTNGNGDGGVEPPDDPEDGGPSLLPCWADPGRSCTTPETVGWALGGLFLGQVALQTLD